MLEAPSEDNLFNLDPAPTPDQDRIAPLALYFSTGYTPEEHSQCKWELRTAIDTANEHYLLGRLVSSLGLLRSRLLAGSRALP